MSWIKKVKPWSEYPVGTMSEDCYGAQWIRVQDGWQPISKYAEPRPGIAHKIMLPSTKTPIDTVEE